MSNKNTRPFLEEVTHIFSTIERIVSAETLNPVYKDEALFKLRKNNISLQMVSESLKDIGVHYLSYKNRGGNAMVCHAKFGRNINDTNTQLILRIVPDIEPQRPNIPQILQPYHRMKVAGFRITLSPLLNTRDVENEHVKALKIGIAKEKFLFTDATTENVGLLKDGTPVVLDGEATKHPDQLNEKRLDEIKMLKNQDLPNIKNWDGEWVGERGLSKQNLLYKTPVELEQVAYKNR